MIQYNVTGMSCAACVARVEKAVNNVEGVTGCAVSLLTNSMGVEGNADSEAVIQAVKKAGYGASLKNSHKSKKSENEDTLKDTETPKLKKRLISSIIILIPLMYVSMGHMMWDWPLPSFMNGNHVAMGIYQLLLSGLIMVINQKFFISGFKGLFHLSPNMDTLVALGSSASFIYSIYALFAMSGAVLSGNKELVIYYMNQFYFESAATILTLITVGKTLEAYSKGKTTDALKALMKLSPKSAVILVDGKETEVEIEKVKPGDKFVVRPGDSIPVDGIVIEGESAVNESALTGESIPVDKKTGDTVSAATINTSGFLICEAKRVGEDTTLAGIIQMVSDAASTKAPIAKIADKVSGVFVPVVVGISIVTFIAWFIAGESLGIVLSRAVSVLVISCPCALGLATPVAIMVGNGVAAKSGILFKTASSLELAGKTKILALDKTGTITTGIMQVTDVIPFEKETEENLITLAASLEEKSQHPISKAITNYTKEKSIELKETKDFETFSGNGLKAVCENSVIYGGNVEYISKITGAFDSSIEFHIKKLAGEGKTPVLFSKDNKLLGIIAVADQIKEDSQKAVSLIKKMGIHVVMLTGDNQITARAIAEKAGVDEVIAELKPDGKEAVIRKLMEKGKVTMAGDGINDAPALTRADTGIAIGNGTDIAIDAADVVLMKNSLMDVAGAITISRKTIKNIHENLFWAFIYNTVGIPLAAGCFIYAFGWNLNPMFGAAAMGLSSFCVVTNALRLNFVKLNDKIKEIKVKNEQENTKMTKTIEIKGMMCPHCEAHVKKALESIDGVVSAEASHKDANAVVTLSKDISEDLLKNAVVDAGYEFISVK